MTNNHEVAEKSRDNYALDDTLAGRITQAAAQGIVTSYPDWIKSKKGLITAYVLSTIGFGALVAYTNAQAEEDGDEPRSPQDVAAKGDVYHQRACSARYRKTGFLKFAYGGAHECRGHRYCTGAGSPC